MGKEGEFTLDGVPIKMIDGQIFHLGSYWALFILT